MSAILDRFRADPDMPDLRRLWRTAKPLLRDAVVAHSPPYPEFPKLKLRKNEGPSNDPSCPSARDIGHEIDVVLYSHADRFGDPQERAWEYILALAPAIETALRRKLFARHLKYMKQFQDDDLPALKELQRYWKKIEAAVPWNEPAAVDHMFKLVAVGLADNGPDECGFSAFEFQTGWDRDHGLGILMHKDRVFAAGGMGELIGTRYDIAAGARAVQEYDRDDGDWVLPPA